MARRVNTRFVMVLTAVLVLLSAGMVVGYIVLRGDSAKNLAVSQGMEQKADALIAEVTGVEAPSQLTVPQARIMLEKKVDQLDPQTFDEHQEKLDRANHLLKQARGQLDDPYTDANDQQKIELLKRMVRLHGRMELDSYSQAAQSLRGNMRGGWAEIVRLDPTNQQAAQNLLEIDYELARAGGQGIENWNQLEKQATDLLQFAPNNALAHRYRGIAMVNRLQRLTFSQEEADRAREHLRVAIEADADKADAVVYLALLDQLEARAALDRRDAERAAALRADSVERLDAYIAEHPTSITPRVRRIAFLRANAAHQEDREAYAGQIEEELETILHLATTKKPTAEEAREAVALVAQFRREPVEQPDGSTVARGLLEAETILRRRVAAEPDDNAAWLALGGVLRQQQRYDAALQALEQGARMWPIAPTVESLMAQQHRMGSVSAIVDTRLIQAQQATNAAQRRAALEAAEQAIARLEQLAPGATAAIQLHHGHLALARNRQAKAIKHLQEANRLFNRRNPQTLRLLARAHEESGNVGAAANAIEQLRKLAGNDLQVAYQLARLRLRENQLEEAASLIESLRNRAPDSPQIAVLHSGLIVAQAREDDEQSRREAIDRAVALLEPLRDTNDKSLVQQLARFYQVRGELEKARSLLEDYQQANPGDREVAQQLVGLDRALGDTDAAVARLEAIRDPQASDAENMSLDMMISSIQGASNEQRLAQVEQVIRSNEDPVRRQLGLWQLYRMRAQISDDPQARAGFEQQAEQALTEARRLDPDNPQLLEMQFERALADRDFATAQKIVNRAAQLNDGEGLDYAGGAFWQGRLELARNNYQQAIRTLQAGLREMPDNPQALTWLATARWADGNADEAERNLRQALDIRPDYLPAWLTLHRIYAGRELHDQALTALEQARRHARGRSEGIERRYLDYLHDHGPQDQALAARQRWAERFPDDHENLRRLASLYMQTDQAAKARQLIEQVVQASPDSLENVAAMALYEATTESFDAGRSRLEQFVRDREAAGETSAADWIALARFLRTGGQVEAALAAYRKAARVEQSDQQAATREMADWLFAMGRFGEAADYYEQLMESESARSPDQRLVVWRRYVETLFKDGRVDEAAEQLNALLARHSQDAQSRMLKGLVAEARLEQAEDASARRQLHEQARLAYDQAVRHAPQSAMPYVQRAGFILRHNPDDQLEQAMTDLNTAIQIDSTMIRPRELLVELYLRQNQVAQAIEAQERLVGVQPRYPMGRVRLAELYLINGRYSDLGGHLNRSEQTLGEQAIWHEYRGRMHQDQGHLDRARESFAAAYMQDRTPARMAKYVRVLLRMGRFDQAMKVLDDQPAVVGRSPGLLAMRAHGFAGQKEMDKATVAFETALDGASGNPGQLEAVMRQFIPALPRETQLALLEPRAADDASGAMLMMLAQVRLAHGQDEQAVADLVAAGKRVDDSSNMESQRLRLLARAYHQAQKLEQARDAYRRLLKREKDDIVALNNLAYLLADDMDQPEEALALAERAMEMVGPDQIQRANVLDTMGWVQYRAGQPLEAMRTLERSVLMQSMVANNMHLAQVYQDPAVNRSESARQALQSARRLAEDQNDQASLKQIDAMLKTLNAAAAAAVER